MRQPLGRYARRGLVKRNDRIPDTRAFEAWAEVRKTLQTLGRSDSTTWSTTPLPDEYPSVPSNTRQVQRVTAACRRDRRSNCVRTPNVVRSLTAFPNVEGGSP